MPLGKTVRTAVCLFSQLVMSKQQHGLEGSRADYIASLALARSQAETHGRFFTHHSLPKIHHDDTHTSRPMPKRLQPSAIPDLRFEPTYLAKLASTGSDWPSIAWITIRDHAISPLLQGLLWGTASVFMQPLTRTFMGWWHQRDTSQPQKEGSVAGWLRQWARSLFPHARPGGSSGTR